MTRVVPIMIWEAWRLTRLSLLMRVIIVSLVGVLLVSLSQQRGDGNAQGVVLLGVFSLVSVQAVLSSLYAKFGEERPGFPFYLGYTRPVPTWLLVLVPMGYFALSMAAMYFVPVLLLIMVFDAQLPLVTGSCLIGLIAIICAMCNWWSMDTLHRGAAWLVAYLAINHVLIQKVFALDGEGSTFNNLMASTLLDYPGLVAAAMLAAGVAVFGVGKQRRGDTIEFSSLFIPRSLPAAKSPMLSREMLTSLEWLKDLYARRCPTHSLVAAEIWRQMKTRGVPVIAAGILVSIVVPILWYALNSTVESGFIPKAPPGTPAAQLPLLFTMTVIPVSLPFFIATTNLFGISKRQGRVDICKFDATLPITTFHQIALRLFVALGSLFISLLVIGIILWHATPLIKDIYDYSAAKAAFTTTLDAMTWFEMIQYGYVYMLQFITVVVFFGILQLLWMIYAWRILYGVSLYLGYMIFLGVAKKHEWITLSFLVNQFWLIFGALGFSTAYVFLDVLRKHVLKPGQAAVIFGIWLLYVLAYLNIQISSGELNFNMLALLIAWKFMICVLPLTAAVLAPWTVAKFRTR